ncbi:ADP-ribosylglycohydrolase family protein, partial [Streptomyces sp. SID7982]|nr:ADP-ribosylglycohydrolase family protein [Streptomyces sp. SID7982]
ELLDELAALDSPLASDEPTDLDAIVAACPHWPGPPESAPGVGDRTAVADQHRLPTVTHAQLHAAWLGRAAGCLLGKPVEKLPLTGIRALAQATGNWPLTTWFTARGVPAELLSVHPWNRRSAP